MHKCYFLVAIAALVTVGCKSTQTSKKAVWDVNATANASGMRDSLSADKVAAAALAASRLKTITFDLDSYTLTLDARDTLKKNAGLIEAIDGKITVQGHADELGTAEYNLALSERRAVAVRDYYKRLGVNSDRLTTVSYGEEKPLCTDYRRECWNLNRRAKTIAAN